MTRSRRRLVKVAAVTVMVISVVPNAAAAGGQMALTSSSSCPPGYGLCDHTSQCPSKTTRDDLCMQYCGTASNGSCYQNSNCGQPVTDWVWWECGISPQ